MTFTQSRTPLTRLLAASALSLALLGGITACAPANGPSQPPGDNNAPSVSATPTAPTTKATVDPNIPDKYGYVSGYITKVISSRVVEFTTSHAATREDLTGDEPSFLVIMDDSAPRPGQTCDEARGIEVLNLISAQSWIDYKDTANGQLNGDNQRQGTLRTAPNEPLSNEILYRSCQDNQ